MRSLSMDTTHAAVTIQLTVELGPGETISMLKERISRALQNDAPAQEIKPSPINSLSRRKLRGDPLTDTAREQLESMIKNRAPMDEILAHPFSRESGASGVISGSLVYKIKARLRGQARRGKRLRPGDRTGYPSNRFRGDALTPESRELLDQMILAKEPNRHIRAHKFTRQSGASARVCSSLIRRRRQELRQEMPST